MTVQAARSAQTFGEAMRTRHNHRRLLLAAVAILVIWEIAALIVAQYAAFPDQVLPTPQRTVASFNELSNYWQGGLGVQATDRGGPETFAGAWLALGHNALITGLRLLAGMLLAVTVGVGLGLLLGYMPLIRRLAFAPLNYLGVLPVLATVPLFAFWFGATARAEVLIIFFGAGITLLRTTLNAVENVEPTYVQAARTLGANQTMVYRTVIMPAILPELRAGVRITLTFAWSLALGAELIGVQDGLGRMMVLAVQFSLVNRMVLVLLAFVLLATVTVLAFDWLADRALRWAP